METIITSVTTSIGTLATDVLGGVAKVIPVALPIVGAGLVVSILIGVFKKTAKK